MVCYVIVIALSVMLVSVPTTIVRPMHVCVFQLESLQIAKVGNKRLAQNLEQARDQYQATITLRYTDKQLGDNVVKNMNVNTRHCIKDILVWHHCILQRQGAV